MRAASLLVLETTWGRVRIRAEGAAVTACDLPVRPADGPAFAIRRATLRAVSGADRACLRAADRFFRAAVAGRAAPRPRLAPPPASPFLRRVWNELLAIPRGETRTYAEVAARAGSPRAARAAGRACGRNALAVFIPCHRVLAANGALGGFSSGLPWKRLLLRAEGALP